MLELFPCDFNELWICYSLDQNKKYIFFICTGMTKGIKYLLLKNINFYISEWISLKR